VMGGDVIFERLKEHLDVGNDETTEDGRITLEHIECNAACDYAPVMTVNWEFMDNQTPESATQLVDDLREGREVVSTRGPRICTWREAERVLAGFPDDRADEGPAAGPASLLGLQIARENDWTAPEGERKSVSSGSRGRTGRSKDLGAQTSVGRAGSENVIEESGAETVGEDAGGKQNPKGSS
jgi:NADH-quinone oxidoreductase subunit E